MREREGKSFHGGKEKHFVSSKLRYGAPAVPQDFATITEAMEIAEDGDTIVLAPGKNFSNPMPWPRNDLAFLFSPSLPLLHLYVFPRASFSD